MVACFVLAGQAARYSRLYRAVTEQRRSDARYGELDGLRAFLDFAVSVTHAASSIVWYRIGVWTWPTTVFYSLELIRKLC